MESDWPQVSAAVGDVIRQGSQLVLNARDDWVSAMHDAALGSVRMAAVAEDPVLAEGTRRTNLANIMHWAAANVSRPGERVSVNMTPEIVNATRDLVRRGLDESALDSFRTAQSVAWQLWMEICFGLTDDTKVLHELLSVTSRSISTFIDDTVEAMTKSMAAERADLARGTHAQRRTTVALLLEGAPIPRARAEAQLGYRLSGRHTAVVLWSDGPDPAAELEAAAADLGRVTDRFGLSVIASASSWWLWLPTDSSSIPDRLDAHPTIGMAVGRTGNDVEGFRTSHFQALTVQRVLSRMTSGRRIARFDDVRLVSLLDTDRPAVDEFVTDVLGDLHQAPRELQATLRTWIGLQCNTVRTAQETYTHRNTIVRRLARAESLLPRPLTENLVDVAVCLEVLEWRGK
ncbi:helix-turn-helix domain-containing protein [Gordonia sp. NPDC003585]|uniref:PucR family transcriptional regulator n=1 Tax=Gordonia sp. NPDC003585 TaxID=3154275 RepID=UPI00339E93E4